MSIQNEVDRLSDELVANHTRLNAVLPNPEPSTQPAPHSHTCLDPECCLDPELLGVVTYLRQQGLQTIASCSGLEGHAFKYPMVRIINTSAEELFKVLDAGNYDGYYIKTWVNCWHRDGEDFLEIEFWGLDCLKPSNESEKEPPV